ncbi:MULTISPECIES: SDR family NAD(P)-dependent oxidoreductase [unclassified Prochlorococcus]|uniref:SDR family NAD(P)-dependent oxidoreductase n=1 Tax=unclassified Prochlorococcus TaxID=2627481 RepID=UPI000533A5EF|nr:MULTISPECIES: SDR family NAD(P)-dependent oxidoreductase [unclassified Prochlorococcus]KGG15107.1 Light-dependent protochlorophyllide reductase [Prochlorococcus sp. MIT 0602]KGG17379.1 Light-dependent protochlorophyllide reductase [Prochlorococcus sp. MIT 0603]
MNSHISKRILITGGTSGIGYQAVLKFIEAKHNLIIPCRNNSSLNFLLNSLKKDNISIDLIESKVEFPIVDLADLSSIETFSSKYIAGNKAIDTLILNAGIQYTGAKSIRRSNQGLELTIAINHIAHQYLSQRMIPLLIKSKTPRVVVTSSEVHDPDSPGGKVGAKAGLGNLDGMERSNEFEMIDGSSSFNPDKAYKDSKLCNILFAKELYYRLSIKHTKIPVLCWAPGLVIPRSKEGFFRYSRKYNEIGQIIFAFIARDLLRITETPMKAGQILNELATSEKYQKNIFLYLSNNIQRPGKMELNEKAFSEEATDTFKSKKLWDLTNSVIGSFVALDPL